MSEKYHLGGKDLVGLIGDDIDVDNIMMFLKEIEVFYKLRSFYWIII